MEPEKIGEMAERCTNYGKRTLPGIQELGKQGDDGDLPAGDGRR